MTAALDSIRIVWTDVESTGISPEEGHRLLEVAAIVTDGNLMEVGEPFETVLYFPEHDVANLKHLAGDYVRTMHEATGLWDRLPKGVTPKVAQRAMIDWLEANGVEPGVARLGGNSITLDRNFLRAEMPDALNYLHYRSYDMTSIGGFFELYRPDVPPFEKAKTHNALDDIRESLAEARYFRRFI